VRPNNIMPPLGGKDEPPQRQTRLPRQTDAETDPAYFTAPDLVKRWRLSERHVRRIFASGALTLTRFGKAVRVAAAEVFRYEADCSMSSVDAPSHGRGTK
jgi:hypothetical protein